MFITPPRRDARRMPCRTRCMSCALQNSYLFRLESRDHAPLRPVTICAELRRFLPGLTTARFPACRVKTGYERGGRSGFLNGCMAGCARGRTGKEGKARARDYARQRRRRRHRRVCRSAHRRSPDVSFEYRAAVCDSWLQRDPPLCSLKHIRLPRSPQAAENQRSQAGEEGACTVM